MKETARTARTIMPDKSSWKCGKYGERWRVDMFLRSIEKNNLKYTEYVGDGDTNSFGAVQETLAEKYGGEYTSGKEDCIGHIQKRNGLCPPCV